MTDFNSAEYWESRYKSNRNSGVGSYGKLAEFKAEVINKFIADKNINSVIEFGCGDGNQLKLFDIPLYIGYDVSDTILKKVRERFKRDNTKIFKNIIDFNNERSDLTLSLDVIFHLIEDSIFSDYMFRLFNSAILYVIIYSSNMDKVHSSHVKHRKFTEWIENNMPDWKLLQKIPNKYPYDNKNSDQTSWSDFFIYCKQK